MKRIFSIILDSDKEVFVCSDLILAEKAVEAIKNKFPDRILSIHDIFLCESTDDINDCWNGEYDLI